MSTPVSTELYVYYHVEAHQRAALEAALPGFFMQLAALGRSRPGILHRTEPDANGRLTWMEVHEGVRSGDAERIEGAARSSGLSAVASGSRHVESFERVASAGAAEPCA